MDCTRENETVDVILECIKHFKYTLAKNEYLNLLERLEAYERDNNPDKVLLCTSVRGRLQRNENHINMMLNRCEEVELAFNLVNSPSDEWQFGSNQSGVVTHYIIDDDGLMRLRVEGIVEVIIIGVIHLAL